MPVVVKFDPHITMPQVAIIPDATPFNDGVMTKAQAAALAGIAGGPQTQLLITPSPPGAVTIYVRNFGSDTTGDGSFAKPFATINHALNTIPLIKIGPNYIVNVDGYTATNPQIIIPPFISSQPLIDTFLTGRHPVFQNEGYVTISALPTNVLTLNAGTTSFSSDPITGNLNITDTSQAWTPNQWRGQLVAGAGVFQGARVISNDATMLRTTSFFNSWTAPINLQALSCVLTNTVSFSHTMQMVHVAAPIVFQGISMLRGATARPLFMQGFTYAEFDACDYGGPDMRGADSFADVCGHIVGTGGTITDSVLECVVINLFLTEIQDLLPFFSCPSLSISATGWSNSFTFDGFYAGEISTSEFDGRHGITIANGNDVTLFNVASNNVTAGFRSNPNGSGIMVVGGSAITCLGNIGGVGNAGAGIEAKAQGCGTFESGQPINLTITGALGDLLVGQNPARTWADFTTNPPLLYETDAVNHLARFGVNT